MKQKMEMAALPGYMPGTNALTENRLREWYAMKRLGQLGDYNLPTANVNLTRSHANTSGFFDCLDLVDEATLSFMIHELGLYSLQELPDLQVMFGTTNNSTKPFPQRKMRQ